jgi:AcrR family transcriptional regulator
MRDERLLDRFPDATSAAFSNAARPQELPLSKRTLHMNRRRNRILDAARELISEQGFENLTMRALAQASGVTVPTIYNLIGNKDAVLGATIHDGTMRFFGDVRSSANPIAILEKNVTELLRQPAYYRPLLRILLNGGASEAMAEIDALYLRHLRETLKAMAERGELEPWVDCDILAERLLSNLYGAASEWATGLLSDETLPVVASFDANIALAGVATETSRRRFQNRARRLQKGPIEGGRARSVARSRDSSRNRA